MNLKRLSLLFLLGLLMGCASVRSNSKHDAIPTFSRILVVSKLQNVSDRYVFEYLNAFPKNYHICTVAVSPISFEKPDDIIQREASACACEVVLTIGLTSREAIGDRNGYQGTVNEYLAEMYTFPGNQPFWRALITTPNRRSSLRNRDYLPPHLLLNRLHKDGIIVGKTPTNSVVTNQ